MKFTLRNNITGSFNTIEFKLFEDFKNQNEYLKYLIKSMNINMDSIIHIRAKTQEYFIAENLKMFIFEQGFAEATIQEEITKRMAKLNYSEMMSNVCLDTCIIHYRKTLKPELSKRKLQSYEYEQKFLGEFNGKKD